jgi:hypothetical protein
VRGDYNPLFMRAVLALVVDGIPVRHEVQGKVVVGRESSCDVVLDDPTVSRRHAAIEEKDGGWVLRDLGSGNGTFVDGRRVETALLAGSEALLFGAVPARFALEESGDLSASQKLRRTLSVPPARRTRPVAAVVVTTIGVLILVSATAWEKGCFSSRPQRPSVRSTSS